MGGMREWFDVCFSNVVLLLAACPGAGVSALDFWATVKEHLKPGLVKYGPNKRGVLTKADEDVLKTVWVTLDPYNELQNAWVAKAGHVYRLYQAGLMNARYAFLLRNRWVMFVLSTILSFLTTPIIAVLQTPAGNDIFNKNKGFTVVKATAHSAVMQVRYLRDEMTGVVRDIAEDIPSLYYFARGFMGSFAPMWNPIMWLLGQDPFSRFFLATNVRYVVPFDPRQFLAVQAPKAIVRLETRGLHRYGFTVNDVRVGDPVWLTVPADARFIGRKDQYSRTEIPGAPMAIVLTEDVRTAKIVMFKGDIFVCEAEKYPDLLTTIHLSWLPTWSWVSLASWITFPTSWLATQCLWLPIRWLTGWSLGMARIVMQDKLLADTRATLADKQHYVDSASASIEASSPTEGVAEMFAGEKFPSFRVTFPLCCVLQFDRVNSTEASEGLSDDELKQQIEDALDEAESLINEWGGFLIKPIGDGGVALFAPAKQFHPDDDLSSFGAWPLRHDEEHPLRDASGPKLVQAAYHAAEDLHNELKRFGWEKIRGGISVGRLTVYRRQKKTKKKGRKPTFFLDGTSARAYQDAARAENAALAGTTEMTFEAAELLQKIEPGSYHVREVKDKHKKRRRVVTKVKAQT